MDYEQREKVDDLKKFLIIHNKGGQDRRQDINALEADLLWDASRFWATVVYKAKAVTGYKTLEEFNQFAKEYNDRVAKGIDTESLFSKYWLPNVLGYVRIAKAISFSVHSFAELHHFRNELQFISSFYGERSNRDKLK